MNEGVLCATLMCRYAAWPCYCQESTVLIMAISIHDWPAHHAAPDSPYCC